MFHTKQLAGREYKQRQTQPPSSQDQTAQLQSNRSFSSYLVSNKIDDGTAVVDVEQKKHAPNVAVSNVSKPTSCVYRPSSKAASYYFPSHHTATNAVVTASQRPLSDLNHSFTSFYLYRNNHGNSNNNNKAVRPFVQESYQSIIEKNCSTILTADTHETTKKDVVDDDSTGTNAASRTNNRSMTNTSRQSSHNHSRVTISYLQEAPTQSTESADSSSNNSSTGSEHNHNDPNTEMGDVSFADRSSFWNEWAEELIHKEEAEYKQNVKIRESVSPDTIKNDQKQSDDKNEADREETKILKSYPASIQNHPPLTTSSTSLGNATNDVSVAYDDPTIVFVETPDNSFVSGHNNSIGDLTTHTGVGSMTSSSKVVHVPRTNLSSQDVRLKSTTTSMVVPYPPALMVMSKAINDSVEEDDEMLIHHNRDKVNNAVPNSQVVENVPEELARNVARDLTTPVEKDVTKPSIENKVEGNELTPKVSGSRVVPADTLAASCPLPQDDDDDDVSPMKSVMTEYAPSNQVDTNDEDREEEQSIIQNTSMSTLAAMNISQATIQLPTLTVFQQAMEYSTMATDHVQQKQYLLAMEYFQRAIDCYLMNHNKKQQQQHDESSTASGAEVSSQRRPRLSVLSAVNIAGCYRNMGTVSRLLERYDDITNYLCKAEEYYIIGRETVEIRKCESIVTLDGQLLNESTSLNGMNQQSTTCSYFTSAEDEAMCLDSMILETIQSRAYYYSKYQDDKEQAAECHEQCLKHLLHIHNQNGWNVKKDERENQNQTQDDEPIREQGVAFVPLSREQHTSLLVKSLEALGSLYRSLVAASSEKASMILFEDAIDILQCRLEQDESTNDDLIKSVSLILRYLSEIYFERQELDKAVDALHDSTAIKLTASGEPCSEALEVMDKMGAAHEQMENYDKALSCYEQTLFARCRFYGNTHFYVAKSLVNVARVTEMKDGCTPDSVELYKAANAIFALHMLSDSPSLDKDVENILQLIPTVIRQGRYEKAISDLNLCLAMADEETNSEIKIDKAQIYFDLGRAYLGMKDYKLATTALTNAMKETGNVKEEDIFALLQRVEFLQREEKNRSSKPNDVSNRAASNPSNTSALSLSYVPDPTLSFHDITFQLQGDRSIYILDDGDRDKIANKEKMKETFIEKSNDPLSDILYQSFIKDPECIGTVAPTSDLVPTPQVQDKTPLHARIRIKLAKKVAKLIALLRAKCQNSEGIRKLKEFSKQCMKACKSKLRMGPQQTNRNVGTNATTSPPEFKNEDVVYASFEEPPPSKFKLAVTSIVTKCSLYGSSIVAGGTEHRPRSTSSAPFSFVHHHVIITEEESGFGCELIHS